MDRKRLVRALNVAGLLVGLGFILFGLLNAASERAAPSGAAGQSTFIPFGIGLMIAIYFGVNLRILSDHDDPGSPNKPR